MTSETEGDRRVSANCQQPVDRRREGGGQESAEGGPAFLLAKQGPRLAGRSQDGLSMSVETEPQTETETDTETETGSQGCPGLRLDLLVGASMNLETDGGGASNLLFSLQHLCLKKIKPKSQERFWVPERTCCIQNLLFMWYIGVGRQKAV